MPLIKVTLPILLRRFKRVKGNYIQLWLGVKLFLYFVKVTINHAEWATSAGVASAGNKFYLAHPAGRKLQAGLNSQIKNQMRKVIAAMNMTLDGFCDHTAMIADDEIHQHYNELLRNADTLIYGRITYQLMESYWPAIVEHPTGNEALDQFAVLIHNIPKVVFSHTLKNVGWKNAKVARRGIKVEVEALRQQPGKSIVVGSPALIVGLMQLDLIDEYQLSVQPTIAGKGLRLFRDINHTIRLKLLSTKTFSCGAITFYYEPDAFNGGS